MRRWNKLITTMGCLLAFAILILFRSDVIRGAVSGIEMCIYTVIPSLFPFIFVSLLSVGLMEGSGFPLFKVLNKRCGIPPGGVSLFLTGLLGGYPTGAQGVYLAYRNGSLSKASAEHLLSFCNNAGPAFIFGVLGNVFSDLKIPFVIWFIQIFSALITGFLLNNSESRQYISTKTRKISLTEALQNSVSAMGRICGWIILFKILISIIQAHLMYGLPELACIFIAGMLELSNGCISLNNLSHVHAFHIANFFLAFGGLCVWLQTTSFTRGLKTSAFFCGKCLQAIISVLLSLCAGPLIFSDGIAYALFALTGLFLIVSAKIVVAFRKKMLYNKEKTRRSSKYAVSKEAAPFVQLL